jgi:hypothetical protein
MQFGLVVVEKQFTEVWSWFWCSRAYGAGARTVTVHVTGTGTVFAHIPYRDCEILNNYDSTRTIIDTENIGDLWEDALDRYEKLAPKRTRRDQNLLMTITTPEALEAHLNNHEESFKIFRSNHGKLTGGLKACMRPFMALSDMISAALSASPFKPASTILGAVCFVLKAAEGVPEVYSWIEELFEKIRDFTIRLDVLVALHLQRGLQ